MVVPPEQVKDMLNGPVLVRPATIRRWVLLASGVRKEVASGVAVAAKRHLPQFFFERLTGLIGLWVGMSPAAPE